MLKDGWGELHGPACKAASTRAFAPCLQSSVHRCFATGSDEDAMMRQLIDNRCGVYDTIYSSPMLISDAHVAQLKAHCVEFGRAFLATREMCRLQGELLFGVKPKVHKM